MIGQTRRQLATEAKQPGRPLLVRSLWVINAILLGVVVLAPASRRAGTSPVDNLSQIVKPYSVDTRQSCPSTLAAYLGTAADGMELLDDAVSSAPVGVSVTYGFSSETRTVIYLAGKSSGEDVALRLPKSNYIGRWALPDTSRAVSKTLSIKGGDVRLRCPAFSGAIVLDLQRTE